MQIAYTMAAGRGDTDLLLHGLARRLQARGLHPAGTVQINTDRADGRPCDMDVAVLPDGPVLRISQDLGPQARGCRLDAGALDTAAGLVAARMADGADVLILNKFGKHEAEGRGLRAVIATALEQGLPVLVGVNASNRAAFERFAGGLAVALPPDPAALTGWADAATRPAPAPVG